MRRVPSLLVVAALIAAPMPALAYSDGDSDKVEDDVDNCEGSANPLQFDVDRDGIGDLCEPPSVPSDDYPGSPGSDLVFGTFRDSVLIGGPGRDGLYGEAGDDVIDGGPGPDILVGGPGDDVMTGGPGCDVFGIHTGIEHHDVITDFEPGIDRVRFPPRVRDRKRDRPPLIEQSGVEHLELTLVGEGTPSVSVVFEGIHPAEQVVLSTEPCDSSPPPGSICPQDGARGRNVYVGLDDVFCPDAGKLWANTGVYATSRYGIATPKRSGAKGGDRLTRDR